MEDTVTLPRLMALNKFWADVPPAHISLARLAKAFLQDSGGGPRPTDAKEKGTLADLMRDFGMAGG